VFSFAENDLLRRTSCGRFRIQFDIVLRAVVACRTASTLLGFAGQERTIMPPIVSGLLIFAALILLQLVVRLFGLAAGTGRPSPPPWKQRRAVAKRPAPSADQAPKAQRPPQMARPPAARPHQPWRAKRQQPWRVRAV
jgi:hypothetical protein